MNDFDDERNGLPSSERVIGLNTRLAALAALPILRPMLEP